MKVATLYNVDTATLSKIKLCDRQAKLKRLRA